MFPNQISEGGKRILDTVQKELFPSLEKLKDILVRIQKVRISWQLYSLELHKLEKEYYQASSDFFSTVRKLQTPDILFSGLENNPQHIVDYFQFQGAFQNNIAQGINYIEIIDRTLDRKAQNIQNNRIFLISITAIVISLIKLIN